MVEFSFVTGAGRVGDEGGGLEFRFSFSDVRDEPAVELEEVEETERLVVRQRSLILAKVLRPNEYLRTSRGRRVLLQVVSETVFHARNRHAPFSYFTKQPFPSRDLTCEVWESCEDSRARCRPRLLPC